MSDRQVVNAFMARYLRGRLPRLPGFVAGEVAGRLRLRLLDELHDVRSPRAGHDCEPWASYERLADAVATAFEVFTAAGQRRLRT